MLAAAARNGVENFSMAQIRQLQVAREEHLVVMLKALLRRWEEGDEQGFMVGSQALRPVSCHESGMAPWWGCCMCRVGVSAGTETVLVKRMVEIRQMGCD
jgi:hypothetical protein